MNWGALSIGLIVGFYWARVLKLVIKTRRQTGKAANFMPPEPLGRVLRLIWYPTVAIWIANPLLVAFCPRLPALLKPLFNSPIAQAIAVPIALLALLATMVCWKRMGRSWRMGIDPAEKTQLIVTGPYAYVRHPIYMLSTLLMIASVVAVPTPLMVIAGTIHLSFLQWEAHREEKYLLEVHGQVYGEYLRHVGRFLPRSLSPYRVDR